MRQARRPHGEPRAGRTAHDTLAQRRVTCLIHGRCRGNWRSATCESQGRPSGTDPCSHRFAALRPLMLHCSMPHVHPLDALVQTRHVELTMLESEPSSPSIRPLPIGKWPRRGPPRVQPSASPVRKPRRPWRWPCRAAGAHGAFTWGVLDAPDRGWPSRLRGRHGCQRRRDERGRDGRRMDHRRAGGRPRRSRPVLA